MAGRSIIQKICGRIGGFSTRIRHALSMQLLYRTSLKSEKQKKNILFWAPGGMPLMLHLEGAIAGALKLRGHKVHAIICDGVFSACVKREITDQIPLVDWEKSCGACRNACASTLTQLGISHSFIGDYVSAHERMQARELSGVVEWDGIDQLRHQNIPVGKNIKSAILRYLKGHDLPSDSRVVQEYAFSGFVCSTAARNAIGKLAPSNIFMSHGVYVDWGPALHTALERSVPVTAWMASYLPTRFYFRHVPDGVHIDFHNISKDAWEKVRASEFPSEKLERLNQYITDRYQRDTSFDMKHFRAYSGHAEEIRKRYGLDPAKPVWGIMCHINWDTVSDYAPMQYESFNDWMKDTVRTIIDIPDVQWIVKIHPAEAWDNPDSGVEMLIKKDFPKLPENIRIFGAEENISPLDFFSLVDGGVTVYGTAGLEMALHGKPVILAGDAHYGYKGFTLDSDSPEAYRTRLRQAAQSPRLSEEQIALARKYAYCYFIQRQIPVSVVKDPKSKWWSFQFDKKELLISGHDPAMDFICQRILDGTDFIMDDPLEAKANQMIM